jgi:PAS domain S-box-containing protein
MTRADRPIPDSTISTDQRATAPPIILKFVNLSPEALLLLNEDGLIQAFSPPARDMLGLTDMIPINRSLLTLVDENDLPIAQQALEHCRNIQNDAECNTLRLRMETAGGRTQLIELALRKLPYDDKHWLFAYLRYPNIVTAMSEQLSQAMQRLQLHVTRTPLAFVEFDLDRRIVEWNAGAERTFLWPRDQVINKSFDIIVPPDARRHVSNIWSDLLKGDDASHSINENLRKDGTTILCEWFNKPLRNADRQVYAVASIVQDISERERLEAQLRQMQKLDSLGVLAGGVAHDFNNLIMVIRGNLELFKKSDNIDQSDLEHLTLIERAAEKAQFLVKQLLDYARSGRSKPEEINLCDLVKNNLFVLKSAVAKGVEISLDLDERSQMLNADPSKIEQVLLNLVINASAAMAGGGDIVISVKPKQLTELDAPLVLPRAGFKPGTYVQLAVSDQGTGIDPSAVERIFDPFYTTKPEGSGLGLASVLGILRQHDAFVIVDSKPDRGTTFKTYWPTIAE